METLYSLKQLKQFKCLVKRIEIFQYVQKQDMGYLFDLGTGITYKEAATVQPLLRQLGIMQFLFVLKKYKNWEKTLPKQCIKWGQEIEGHFLEEKNGKLRLMMSGLGSEYECMGFPVKKQYCRWMLEITPPEPYSAVNDYSEVISSLLKRFKAIQDSPKICLMIPNIPLVGLTQQGVKINNQLTHSQFIDDIFVADIPAYVLHTINSYQKRGNPHINLPLFIDSNTNLEEIALTEPNPKFIHLDSIVFGGGVCALQVTFSSENFDHARYIHDQLHIMSPLLLALTAGAPFFKGKIADTDCRWKVFEDALDCRTDEQKDEKSEKYQPTRRSSPSSLFLWPGEFNQPEFNDLQLKLVPQTIQMVKAKAEQMSVEIDDLIVSHLANLFKRDALIIFKSFIDSGVQDPCVFESVNQTNLYSVKLKIPFDENSGWMVQLRTMEVQLTAELNAVFCLLANFLVRVLHKNKFINFYLPMSKVHQNFDRAIRRDAVRKEKFWFRTNILGEGEPILKQMALHEFMFGTQNFPGFLNFLRNQLTQIGELDDENNLKIFNQVVDYLRGLTQGKILTLAQWMRNYVDRHAGYSHNSILSVEVIDDLLKTLYKISKGTATDPNFPNIFK